MAQPALMAGLVLAGLTLGAQATPAEEIKVETLTPRPRATLTSWCARGPCSSARV